ncbi:hypothetical protein PUR71_00605, partial [Streptomyces sp. SP17BM10]|nr:hypothetical protein [Streptomyces sp. SP17BM10]
MRVAPRASGPRPAAPPERPRGPPAPACPADQILDAARRVAPGGPATDPAVSAQRRQPTAPRPGPLLRLAP